MSAVSIRLAREADMPEIAGMTRLLASEANAPVVPRITGEQLAAFSLGVSPVLITLAAEDEEGLAGMIIASPVVSTWRGLKGLYICDLYVARRARRRGLAQALMAAALRQGDFAYLKLEVDRGNAIARALYEKMGFKPNLDDETMFLDAAPTAALRGG